jgi:uncharacterized repeat protein (TIGR03943 family)
MTPRRSFLEAWWRPLVFFTWLWALTGLLKNERYTTFLRPEFGYVIGVGVFTLLGFLVSSLQDRQPKPFGIRQVLRALILLLPIAHLMNAQGTSLDKDAFQNRSLGLPSVHESRVRSAVSATSPDPAPSAGLSGKAAAPGTIVDASLPKPGAKQNDFIADNPFSPAEPPIASLAPAKKVTHLDLYDAPKLYEGKRVRLIGMLHKNDPGISKNFGKEMSIVFRFKVSCCVADATPAAVLIDSQGLPDFPEGTWVELEGRFKILEKNGQLIPSISAPKLKQTQPPKQPYLY